MQNKIKLNDHFSFGRAKLPVTKVIISESDVCASKLQFSLSFLMLIVFSFVSEVQYKLAARVE